MTQFCGLFFPAATGNMQNSDHICCGDDIKKNFSTSKPQLNVSGLVKVPSLCSRSCHRHWDGVCPCGGAEHRGVSELQLWFVLLKSVGASAPASPGCSIN